MNTERALSCLILALVGYMYSFDPHSTCAPPPTFSQWLVVNALCAAILGASTMSLLGWARSVLARKAVSP